MLNLEGENIRKRNYVLITHYHIKIKSFWMYKYILIITWNPASLTSCALITWDSPFMAKKASKASGLNMWPVPRRKLLTKPPVASIKNNNKSRFPMERLFYINNHEKYDPKWILTIIECIPFFKSWRVWAAGGKLEDSGGSGSFHKNSHTNGEIDSGSGRSLLTLSKAVMSPSDWVLELFRFEDVSSHGGGIPPCTQNT